MEYGTLTSEEEEEEEDETGGARSIKKIIDEIGIGRMQAMLCFIGGAIWAADGAELLIIASVTRAIDKEWDLMSWQRGSLVSFVMFGVLLGNSASGPLGDSIGRRSPMLLSYAGIALFSVLSATTSGFYALAAVRLAVGASFGLGQPPCTALQTELTPRKWRTVLCSGMLCMFPLGEIYAALLIWYNDPTMKNLDWRWLCVMAAVPAMFGWILCYFLLCESPSYLAGKGKHAEAREVLEGARKLNKAEDVSLEFTIKPKRDGGAIVAMEYIFSSKMIFRTFTMMYSCCVLNLLYYGSLYAIPQVFQEVDVGYGPAIGLFLGALWEISGYVLSCMMATGLRRDWLFFLYFGATILSLLSFLCGADRDGLLGGTLLQMGYFGIRMMPSLGFTVVYQLSFDSYPTFARTTGGGACVAAGRLGGILAPALYEQVYEMSGWRMYFLIMVASLCANAVLLMCQGDHGVKDENTHLLGDKQ